MATVDLVKTKKFPVKMKRNNNEVIMNLTRIQARSESCVLCDSLRAGICL